jgi:hypothetical protein
VQAIALDNAAGNVQLVQMQFVCNNGAGDSFDTRAYSLDCDSFGKRKVRFAQTPLLPAFEADPADGGNRGTQAAMGVAKFVECGAMRRRDACRNEC